MSEPLLTIAIPTFNRDAKLASQLLWFSRNLSAETRRLCAIMVSDNASDDGTACVCREWRDRFDALGVPMQIHRNPQNIGPLPNIAHCINASAGRFTWVVGDDDVIDDGTLGWIIRALQADPNLASIVMNFRSVGKTSYPRCFEFDSDQLGEGTEVITRCLRQAYFGLAFMTAQVYRTEFAQRALRHWPGGKGNYDYQVFITAFAGSQGKVMATREPRVTYVTGDNVYERDKRVGMRLYADSLEVFLRLRGAGFERSLCKSLGRQHLSNLKKRYLKNALQISPIHTLKTTGRLALYATQLAI